MGFSGFTRGTFARLQRGPRAVLPESVGRITMNQPSLHAHREWRIYAAVGIAVAVFLLLLLLAGAAAASLS